MKELSIEQKAKAYDEALRVLHKYDGVNILFSQSLKEEMFPELAESEDERIRKAIITLLSITIKGKKLYSITDTTRSEMLAWLEKQGEQKSAEWNEEDEIGLADTMWALKQARTIAKDENDMGNLWYAENWLKSLKDRYTWKPSDKQMEYLAKAITTLGDEGDCKTALILNDLRFELKKLKGE